MKWMNGECKVIVANSSFGMGIDKKGVRFIVHARLPTSIDECYQECGRAGRDKLPSTCTLYMDSTWTRTCSRKYSFGRIEWAIRCYQ